MDQVLAQIDDLEKLGQKILEEKRAKLVNELAAIETDMREEIFRLGKSLNESDIGEKILVHQTQLTQQIKTAIQDKVNLLDRYSGAKAQLAKWTQ